jgi:hypothetical protein
LSADITSKEVVSLFVWTPPELTSTSCVICAETGNETRRLAHDRVSREIETFIVRLLWMR